jgi:hypothetical protein
VAISGERARISAQITQKSMFLYEQSLLSAPHGDGRGDGTWLRRIVTSTGLSRGHTVKCTSNLDLSASGYYYVAVYKHELF